MKKIVPLTQVKGNRSLNTLLKVSNGLISKLKIPNVQVNWTINYDSEGGTLYVVKPDGTTIYTSGFNLLSIFIGENSETGITLSIQTKDSRTNFF